MIPVNIMLYWVKFVWIYCYGIGYYSFLKWLKEIILIQCYSNTSQCLEICLKFCLECDPVVMTTLWIPCCIDYNSNEFIMLLNRIPYSIFELTSTQTWIWVLWISSLLISANISSAFNVRFNGAFSFVLKVLHIWLALHSLYRIRWRYSEWWTSIWIFKCSISLLTLYGIIIIALLAPRSVVFMSLLMEPYFLSFGDYVTHHAWKVILCNSEESYCLRKRILLFGWH